LSEAFENFRQKFGRREDDEHRERDLDGRWHESIMERRANGPTHEWALRTRE
jgi:hypothetical protein